jgi:hypothetical protein
MMEAGTVAVLSVPSLRSRSDDDVLPVRDYHIWGSHSGLGETSVSV